MDLCHSFIHGVEYEKKKILCKKYISDSETYINKIHLIVIENVTSKSIFLYVTDAKIYKEKQHFMTLTIF